MRLMNAPTVRGKIVFDLSCMRVLMTALGGFAVPQLARRAPQPAAWSTT